MFTITKSEVAVLNAARGVLEELDARALEADYERQRGEQDMSLYPRYPDGFDLGRVAEACDVASDAIFNALNTAKHYGKVATLSEEEVVGK